MGIKRKMNEFEINKHLKLKLVNRKTIIYVNNHIFNQCNYILLNIPIDGSNPKIKSVESIDEAAEMLDRSLEGDNQNEYDIPPETEFWGHCSNLQAWYEHAYDTRLLHSNLAFPLLRRLSEVGDPTAKKVFKEEIVTRLESQYKPVTEYLLNQNYLDFFSFEELKDLLYVFKDRTDIYDKINKKIAKINKKIAWVLKIKEIKKIPGLGDPLLKKLAETGYTTLPAIVFTPPGTLAEDVGIGSKTAYKIIESAKVMLNIRSICKAAEVADTRKKMHKLKTGSQSLDDLLNGGFESGTLIEIFGEYRTGKTQLIHQVCVNVQLSYEDGGLEGHALYLDTENNFRPERILQMAGYLHLDEESVLNNILIGKIYNSDHQINIIKELVPIIRENHIKLLCIDSIISHFRSEYIGRGMASARQQQLCSHLAQLKRLTAIFPDIVIIITNQVSTKPDVFYGNPNTHTGGHVLAHAPNTRIYLKKGKGINRSATIVKSSFLPEATGTFTITENGIGDSIQNR